MAHFVTWVARGSAKGRIWRICFGIMKFQPSKIDLFRIGTVFKKD
jgi:hypothetical protein